MASAVLTSRNEPYWGEHKVYMRKHTNNFTNNYPNISRFNPNPNPNPDINSLLSRNPSPGAHPRTQNNDSSVRAIGWHAHEQPPACSRDSSLNREGTNLDDHLESSQIRYVTFRLASYTRRELKHLKKRLISELNRVRSLRNQIEAPEIESRHGYHVSNFPDSSERGGEVILRPTFQPDHALQSPVPDVSISEKGISKAKKNKKTSSQKRAMPFASGRDSKRPALANSPMGKLMKSMMKRCGQILTKLMKHKHGWVFNTPVDAAALGLYDYHKIIRHPMDLGTVQSKLGKNEYESPLDFSSDVKLIFNNALSYNPNGSDVYIMAQILLSRFEQMFIPAYQNFDAEYRRVLAAQQINRQNWSLPPSVVPVVTKKTFNGTVLVAEKSNCTHPQTTSSSPPAVQIQQSTSPVLVPSPQAVQTQAPSLMLAPAAKPARTTAKMGKPKARDPNKREMTFDEKTNLAMSLSSLPPGPDGMDQIMKIIKRRISGLAPDEDEIELDIEALDNETLWELDRFAARCHKKAAAKMERAGVVSNLVPAVQINNMHTGIDDAAEQRGKNGDAHAVEEDVDIGEEMPITNFPFVEIEKDAVNGSGRSSRSSGSSSGSDSSSSVADSDSGSSSGCESDAVSVVKALL